jgi:serine/threonine protein kinase
MCYDHVATSTSDLWSFACILFKLYTGESPFPGTSQTYVFKDICKGKESIAWPFHMDEVLRDFLEKILEVDPTKRLGCPGTEHDMEALKSHKLF